MTTHLAAKDENPEEDRRHARTPTELGVRGGERLVGEILTALARDAVSEHAARGHDAEKEGGEDGYEELNDANNERDLRCVVEACDVDGGTSSKGKNDDEEDETAGEVRGVVPGCGDVGESEIGK